MLCTKLDGLVPEALDQAKVPGAAIGVIRAGEVVLQKCYGFADREQERKVTPETVFNIGSISKTVAAWGILRLVQEQEISLGDAADDLLTTWHLPNSEFDAGEVTVRRLLSHTAGLSLHGYPGFPPDQALPTVIESLNGATNGAGSVQLIMDPGTKWKYSGGGYTIAQLILEEITGRQFAESMREQILLPLGMNDSYFVWNQAVQSTAAVPYDAEGHAIPPLRFTAAAAAGLQTSLDDFCRFAVASLPDHPGEIGFPVLESQTIREMQVPANEASDRYGLGYGIEQDGKFTLVGHSGANDGWMSSFWVVPETGDGMVVFTNGSSGQQVIRVVDAVWRRWLRSSH